MSRRIVTPSLHRKASLSPILSNTGNDRPGSTQEERTDGRTFESDWVGTVRAFTTAEIHASRSWEQAIRGAMQRSDYFWASQKDGAIVHYADGFEQFVRGRVVTMPDGTKAMQPIALVGNRWRDEVSRWADGTVHYSYHAEHVVNGTGTFQPNASTVWESPSCAAWHKRTDPRTLPPINLTPPPVTPEQEAEFAKVRRINAAQDALNGSGTADQRIAAALAILSA